MAILISISSSLSEQQLQCRRSQSRPVGGQSFGVVVKDTDHTKAPALKSAIVDDGMSQVSSAYQGHVPDSVHLQNAPELIAQIGDVVAHSLLAKLAKMGQVLAYLGRADAQPLRQILGGGDPLSLSSM